jgi:predicted RNA binding protein YcfA (HicA-like mRNA interferase family)
MPISGKDLVKLFLRYGYKIIKKQGKGSHIKLRKEGKSTVIIPDHKELSKGLEKALRKILGN